MSRQHGFTLVELVTVIIILGVVSIGIASFMRSSIQVYVDVGEREQLLTESRFAIERLKREIKSAAPHSMRIAGTGAAHCLEFVPINWSTTYLSLPVLPDSGKHLEAVFPYDINNRVYTVTASDFALVYPRQSEDVYDASRNKLRQVVSCSDADGNCATLENPDETIDVEVAGAFAESSPASRLYLVDHSVSFCVTGGRLVRFENDITPTQTLPPASAPIIATHVANALSANPLMSPQADDPFRIYQATLKRNAIIQIRLRFSDNGEQIVFQHEVHVANAP